MFSQALENENILKRTVDIQWQNDIWTESSFTYYSSKNELRITKFGRSFPFLNPEQTGALFVLTRQTADQYSAFFLETEDDIEQFLSAFGIGPTETNHMIDTSAVLPERQERIAIQEFIDTLTVDFRYLMSCPLLPEIFRTVFTTIWSISAPTLTAKSLNGRIRNMHCSGQSNTPVMVTKFLADLQQ